MTKIYTNLFCSFIVVLFFTSTSFAQIFVKHDAAGDNNGTSWEDAFTDLNQALLVTTAGDIWVASGTYLPNGTTSDSSATFKISSNLNLFGGYYGNYRRVQYHGRKYK